MTRGSHGYSVWAILHDLISSAQFQSQMQRTRNSQGGALLDDLCERLFGDVGALDRRIGSATESTPDEELQGIEQRRCELVIEYRRVVDEVLQFLDDTTGEHQRVQDESPFSVRVRRYLADEYDRFMDSALRLRTETPEVARCLQDEHLSRFPRKPLLG